MHGWNNGYGYDFVGISPSHELRTPTRVVKAKELRRRKDRVANSMPNAIAIYAR